jgi:hypothetical protein
MQRHWSAFMWSAEKTVNGGRGIVQLMQNCYYVTPFRLIVPPDQGGK